MAKTQDFSQMGDEEFMESWTEAAEELDAARDRCRAYSAEHHRREAERQQTAAAQHEPSDLDQTVGSI